MAIIEKTTEKNRYKADPTVMKALRTPRILTREVLAGLVVAMALIPEAIAFSIIAGVDPRVGLFSTFIMAVSIAFLGGRPAMITGATAAIALVIAPVARDYGIDYFIATVILAGIFQIVFAFIGVAKIMRFIPRSVMVGFVNALGILIFTSQLPQLLGVPFMVYPLVAVGIIIMVVMPRFTKVVPAPLVAIVVLTILTVVVSINVPTIGDQGKLPTTLPQLFFPNVPLNMETLTIIAPYAFGMAMVGILESLMAAKIVDESTDTHSNKTRESWAQGVSNMLSGFFGGMGGCAMVGQTMINVKASGARTRISTFLAGLFLLVLVLGLGDVLSVVPMAALVAVMIIVSVLTFDWHSIRLSTLKRMPKSETTVMVATVIAVVATHNLAVGVVIGVVIAMVAFARRVAHLAQVERSLTVDDQGPVAYYTVTGALFFASSNDLKTQFSYLDDPDRIIIDMTNSHIWDASTVATLDDIKYKYERHEKTVTIEGLNEASSLLHARLAGNMGSGH
ncbi:SulP family inorganic anion transporter [Cryobacterium sp. N19]|uniref:SulP family inorganic anion transporter n=1 Tax=Cryobacterium sp. N19 TaxID=2048288 RepID=UPI000CE47ED5|nr:SulP family inorganic anion transporter [Cryobacterium sp. N19]